MSIALEAAAFPFVRLISIPAIENQSGLIKKYRLIERSSADGDEQIAGWKRVINSLEPNHDDDTLLTTLRMYERWSQQYSCRLVLLFQFVYSFVSERYAKTELIRIAKGIVFCDSN